MYMPWHDCFEHFCLGVQVLLFHEQEKEEKEEVVGVVVGMEYLVSLSDVGMQVFLFFSTRSRWGWNILCTFRMWGCKFFCVFKMMRRWGCMFFRTGRRSKWNVLRMWGLRRRRRRGTI
jgi:hypothetical protein